MKTPLQGQHLHAPEPGHRLHRSVDLAAAWLSLGCALHCMLLPLLLALLPSALLALRSFHHPWHGPMTLLLRLSRWEWLIAIAAASLCLSSTAAGWRRHGQPLPLLLAVAGGGALLLAAMQPQLRDSALWHGLLAATGGALMASAHLCNRALLKRFLQLPAGHAPAATY